MIDPLVRAARNDDAHDIAALEREARASLVDARGGARWLEQHPAVDVGWSTRIAAGGVYVAELDAAFTAHGPVIVGFVVLDHRDDVAVIDQVYVEPDARELGFGDALLEVAIDEARAAGARLLEGEALPGDRNTKNLYERAGITARLITVSTPL